jgi:RHS repeat-associated protein
MARALRTIGLGLLLSSFALVFSPESVGAMATSPMISSVNPNAGTWGGGNFVTISGTGFTDATTVTFNDDDGNWILPWFVVDSDNRITVVAPTTQPTYPGDPSTTVNVQVSTPNGVSVVTTDDEYTFTSTPRPPSDPPATISSIEPSDGLLSGGNTVVITGTGLAETDLVQFGGGEFCYYSGGCRANANDAEWFSVNSDNQITAQVPPGFAGSAAVNVYEGGGVASNPLTYTYTSGTSSLSGPSTIAGGSPDVLPTSCSCGDPVNTTTGEFWHTFSDLSIPGKGIPLELTRTYSSMSASDLGPFGYGWTDSYNMSLSFDSSGDATVHEENGSEVTANYEDPGYEFPSYVFATLAANPNGTYTFTRHDGSQYLFSASGHLLEEIDRNGYVTTLSYNPSDQLETVTDPTGRTLTFSYGSNGLVSSLADSSGRSVSYTYDSTDELTGFEDAGGGKWSFTYNSDHLMLSMTDPDGGTTTNTYDSSGRVLTQTDPMGRTTTYSYSGTAGSGTGSTTLTDPVGNQTLYQYADFELSSVSHGYETASEATTSYTYDPDTLGIVASTDPNGNTTSYTYDSEGDLLSKTDPLGRMTSYTYNSFGEVTSETNPLGVTTTNAYDPDGNLLSTATPVCSVPPCASGSPTATTTYTYGDSSEPGEVTAMTDPDGNTTAYAYDSYGDQTSVTDPNGKTTNYAYNIIGEKTSSKDALGQTTKYTYDALGDLLTVTDPLGGKTTNTYDADQSLISTIDPDGNKTTYTYDLDNELTKTTEANGVSTSKSYDSDGNVVSTTNADGNSTTYTYNRLRQLATVTNPLGETTTFTYDLDGDRTSLTDPEESTTTYTYDADNELTSVSYSDGTTPDVNYTYDADGQRLSMTDGTGATTYNYDSLGRLASSKNGAARTVDYAYDLDGNVASITYPNGDKVTDAYDPDGNLTSVTDWLGNTSTFTYNADNDLVTQTTGSSPAVSDTYAYDSDGNLISIKDTSGSKELQGFTYKRDADNLVTSVTPSGSSTENYSYDSVNELTSDAQGSYSYDPAANITKLLDTKDMAYNVGDELVSAGKASKKTTFSYNSDGDRVSETTPKATTTYTYDQEERLISFTRGSTTASYSYNGDGLRMSKTVEVTKKKKATTTTTAFTWDTETSTPILLAAGDTNYIYGPGGLPLEQIKNSTVAYYHHNQLGSTTMLTSSTGADVATFGYDSYGSITSSTGTATTPLLYDGQYMDSESGLYYLRARYYDSATGQFLTVDPDLATTDQPYSYTSDDPVNGGDPSGLCAWWDIGCEAEAVGSAAASTISGAASYASSAVSGCEADGWGCVQTVAADVGAGAGAVALGCGVAALITSETIVLGAAFGACAGIAAGVGMAADGLNGLAQLEEGDAPAQVAEQLLPKEILSLVGGEVEVGSNWAAIEENGQDLAFLGDLNFGDVDAATQDLQLSDLYASLPGLYSVVGLGSDFLESWEDFACSSN